MAFRFMCVTAHINPKIGEKGRRFKVGEEISLEEFRSLAPEDQVYFSPILLKINEPVVTRRHFCKICKADFMSFKDLSEHLSAHRKQCKNC